MSFSLDIEIDSSVSKAVVIDILRDMSFILSEESVDDLRGNFPESNMYAVIRWISQENDMVPRTEGADFAKDWKIGVRASFKYVISRYDQSSKEMHRFLALLCERSSAFFVLSFEMETIFAVRDEAGLRVVDRF
ncbi:hypothetical protein AB9X41_23480 [Ralstonia solanacearum]|uniref:Uncharacterized protein n=1 Tax=Ralstonia solanacearum TaxID=305 RepID=A0AAE3T5Q2_RALSL|nr:hypothetical protein [Ralstonia solanacearum]MBB6584317.1 hypothetical protein [Ralstonia solanacearum]MDB0524426.1 hypothetical protein [Ralstonia solanacearum]